MANLRRLVVAEVIVTLWIALCALVFGLCLDFFESQYFNFGPSSDLLVLGLGICIDTWTKYALIMLYAMMNPFIMVYTADMIYPWINSVVMNPDVKTINIPIGVAWMLTNYMWIISSISGLFSIGLSMTQFDFFAAGLVAVAVSGMITSYITLSDKEFNKVVDMELEEV